MYKTSEFADLTGLSKETLRYYAEVKLLEPAYINPVNKYRYYDDGSYFLAILLVKLKGFGCTIQEMISVMEDKSFSNLESLLMQKRNTILIQIDSLTSKLGELYAFLVSGREKEE
ncbi:MAG: MerR family transcriptional regulator [Psychrobacillus psychrotolerans]